MRFRASSGTDVHNQLGVEFVQTFKFTLLWQLMCKLLHSSLKQRAGASCRFLFPLQKVRWGKSLLPDTPHRCGYFLWVNNLFSETLIFSWLILFFVPCRGDWLSPEVLLLCCVKVFWGSHQSFNFLIRLKIIQQWCCCAQSISPSCKTAYWPIHFIFFTDSQK